MHTLRTHAESFADVWPKVLEITISKQYYILFTHSQQNNNTYCHFNTFTMYISLLYLYRFLLCIKYYVNSGQTFSGQANSQKTCFLKVTQCDCFQSNSDYMNEILPRRGPTFKLIFKNDLHCIPSNSLSKENIHASYSFYISAFIVCRGGKTVLSK